MAEAVTLAHVARPWTLAKSLDQKRYQVIFAAHPRFDALLGDAGFQRESLETIDSAQFMRALAKGSPVYSAKTLAAYVEQDLALIDRVKPDIIVGDFRLSLSVSARLVGIPYVAISNIYWSGFAKQEYIVPELPLTKILGVRLAQAMFNRVRPLAFGLHTIPLNSVRKKHGLPSLGWRLQDVYTDADHVVYADLPDLARYEDLPSTHRFIGPIIWSPETALPAWWADLPPDRPLIYATMGSSGNQNLLPGVIESLRKSGLPSMVAGAGAALQEQRQDRMFFADYLPGAQAAERASVVICNGGSPTTYQALAAGVPVIGIARNLDQFLNMRLLEKAGVGILLRSDRFKPAMLSQSLDEILSCAAYREKALQVKQRIAQLTPRVEFPALLARI
jgi:UDP:flavonoid glycosyltransferase YjiC (YdhE family)